MDKKGSKKLEQRLLNRVTETRHYEKVHCKMKYKYVTNREEERNMTDECPPCPRPSTPPWRTLHTGQRANKWMRSNTTPWPSS